MRQDKEKDRMQSCDIVTAKIDDMAQMSLFDTIGPFGDITKINKFLIMIAHAASTFTMTSIHLKNKVILF